MTGIRQRPDADEDQTPRLRCTGGKQTVTLHMEFTVKLAYVYARMDNAGDFVMAGQWFPKLAVYEPRGGGDKTHTWNLNNTTAIQSFMRTLGIHTT